MGCVLTLLQEGREDVPAGGLEGHWRVRVLVWQEFMDSLVHEHHEGSHAKHDCKEASINFRLHWVQIGQNFSLGVLREGHKKFSTENNIFCLEYTYRTLFRTFQIQGSYTKVRIPYLCKLFS